MKLHPLALAAALCAAASASACDDCNPASHAGAHDTEPGTRTALGLVTVSGATSTSLPTVIPTTLEGVTAADIARRINATDAEDALKYLPSLLVRKRYIGDYNHAILSSRASGTGNSARSALVYVRRHPAVQPTWATALAACPSRRAGGWSTPEEIERVDVMYGPFSAAYPRQLGRRRGGLPDAHAGRKPSRPTSKLGLRTVQPWQATSGDGHHLPKAKPGQRLGRQPRPGIGAGGST